MPCDTQHLEQSCHLFEVSLAKRNLLTHLYIFLPSEQVWKTVPDVPGLSEWLIIYCKKKFGSSSLEDFDVWRKTKKTIKSTFRTVLLTKKFYVNRKFRNFKKFLRTHSKRVEKAILQAKVQVFYPRKSIASHQSIASLITQQLPNFPQT